MDAYLALTPLLVLGIIGLIRFIGCNWFWGLEPTVARVEPVDGLQFVSADQRVTLSWGYLSTADITGFRIDVTGGNFDPVPPLGASARSVIVTGLTNGTLYTFSVVAERGTNASEARTVQAAPGVTSYILDAAKITGFEHPGFTGFVGMEIFVGANPIIVTQLGRIVVRANSGLHQVKIVKPVTTPSGLPVDGVDVVSVNVMTIYMENPQDPADNNAGTFAWTPLPQPATLQPNTIYFVVSAEIAGADLWYDQQPFPTTGVASLRYALNTIVGGPDDGKYVRGNANQGYVPVSFRY
jgi:fibronectin type III domain protein